MAVAYVIKTHDLSNKQEYYWFHSDKLFTGSIGGASPFESEEEAWKRVNQLVINFDTYIYQVEKVVYKPKR